MPSPIRWDSFWKWRRSSPAKIQPLAEVRPHTHFLGEKPSALGRTATLACARLPESLPPPGGHAGRLHAGERGCALERTRVLQTFPKRPQNTFQDLRSPVLPTCNLLSLIIATGTSSTSRRRRRSGSAIPRCRKRLAPSRRESRRSSGATQSILLMVRSRFSQRHSSHG